MTAPAVELTGVGRRFGEVVALDDVTLRIGRGELVAVVGRSGSGKSTLLNVAGTLDRATSGTVRIDGIDTGALADRRLAELRGRTIGFVFQAFHLDERLTAEQNVMTALLYSGVPRARRRGVAREVLDRVGLAHRFEHRAGTLSGGEKQRVAIARAVATDPVLVLADEPTGALDTTNGELVVALLERLRDDGGTIVVITHDRALAERLPRRVELSDGRLVADTGGPAGA